MKTVRRAIAVCIAGLVLVVAVGFYWLRSSVPRIDGTIAVTGAAGPVEILRDRYGIPHIRAQSEADAYFGLGYVHAQDRLWQMDAGRHAGAGRLSEIFGARTLDSDRYFRTVGFHRSALANLDGLSPDARTLLDAYVAGVNAYQAVRTGPLPPEFVLFGHQPGPWTPVDSLLLIKMMAQQLSGNAHAELLRSRLAEILSPAQIASLWSTSDGAAPVTEQSHRPIGKTLATATGADLLVPSIGAGGSNNWVIDGSRSESGSPILANDPHLGLTAPAAWYLAHMTAPGLNVAGATLPGIPAVIVGRNQQAAWGVTNTGPDVQDLFVEQIDATDATRYLTPGGPMPFVVHQETIRIKGDEPVSLRVRETRHGPVISDVGPRHAAGLNDNQVMALAWTALAQDDPSLQAGFGLARAKSWSDLYDALRDFKSPQQNFVGADIGGGIGFVAAGRVPIRRSGRGWVPATGWSVDGDWIGEIGFADLPQTTNPEVGHIITANQNVTRPGYEYFITDEWAMSYRADRIAARLAERDLWTVDGFKSIQTDHVSLFAQAVLPLMLPAVENEPQSDAAERLAAWSGDMDADKPEPLIFYGWYRNLSRNIVADELGRLLPHAWGWRPGFIRRVLTVETAWCDDRSTTVAETCDDQIRKAYRETIVSLMHEHGKSIDQWRWGKAHQAHSVHRAFTGIPVLGRLFDIRLPHDGGPFTVMQGNSRISSAEPFKEVHGASLRVIFDLADIDSGQAMISTGQSGNRFSRWYQDLSALWVEGLYVPLPLSEQAVARATVHRLRLEPVP